MSPVFIFLIFFIVGAQSISIPAPPDHSGESFRVPEPGGDRGTRLPKDTANQKWIRRIEDYARTQMTQGLGLLNPFRLNLPLYDSAEALPVLVLPVPIYGGCIDIKNRHQSDRDTGIISDEFPQQLQYNTNYIQPPNSENKNTQNTNFIAVAGSQPNNSILNKSYGNTNQHQSLSKTNNHIPMFSPNDGYHFVAPVRAAERPTYPHQGVQVTFQSNPITTPADNKILHAVLRPQAAAPKRPFNSGDDYSSPFFYRPFSTRAPFSGSKLTEAKPIEPSKNSHAENFPSPPSVALPTPFMPPFIPKSSIVPASFSIPSSVPLLTTVSPVSATSNNNSSSSVNAKDSQEIVSAKNMPPLPLPLTTVLPTINMDPSRDYEDFIQPRFFN